MIGIGGPEIVLLLVLGLLLFGAGLPRIGRSAGKTVKEFRSGLQELKDDINSAGTTAQFNNEVVRPPQRLSNR